MAGSYSSYHSGGKTNADFSKLADQIGSYIQKFSQNVTSLKRLVNQVGTPQDSERLRSELMNIQAYTNELAQDTRDRLKDLNSLTVSDNKNEQNRHKMQFERLTNEFSQVLQTFQTVQRELMKKTKNSIPSSQYAEDQRGIGDERGTQLIQLESPVQAQATSHKEDEVQLEILREQEETVQRLESYITTVNEIFRDLGTMVHEQGEVVDSIEAQIEATSIHVGEGEQQLIKARDYRSSLRKKKVCLFVILVLVIAIIIGIIVWQTSN